jgi:hypothetical protein
VKRSTVVWIGIAGLAVVSLSLSYLTGCTAELKGKRIGDVARAILYSKASFWTGSISIFSAVVASFVFSRAPNWQRPLISFFVLVGGSIAMLFFGMWLESVGLKICLDLPKG